MECRNKETFSVKTTVANFSALQAIWSVATNCCSRKAATDILSE